MIKAALIGACALGLLAGLSACGRQADLEAPQARETERAQRSPHADNLPEPATINRPSSQQPIDGGPSNPFGGGPGATGQ